MSRPRASVRPVPRRPARRWYRSLFARAMLAIVAAGGLTVAVAIFFASRTLVARADAALVDFAIQTADQTRAAVVARLDLTDAELDGCLYAFAADRALEIPDAVSGHVTAVRLRAPNSTLEAARVDVDGERLAALADAERGRRWIGDGRVLVVRERDDVRIEALVDVSDLLPHVPGGSVWIDADDAAAVGDATVAHRRHDPRMGDVADATTSLGPGLVLRTVVPLAPARAELDDTIMQILASSALALVALVVVAWLLARGVTRPVLALAESARQLELGEAPTFPEERHDEIGELAHAMARMTEALRRDNELFGSTAALARELACAREPARALEVLERELRAVHPEHQWRVVSIADVDEGRLPSNITAAEVEDALRVADLAANDRDVTSSAVFAVHRTETPAGERLVVGLATAGMRFGVLVQEGARVTTDDLRHVEVLARTTLAALRSLELAHHSVANEKLTVLGRLAASVAHEMNNPLSFVLMNLEILSDTVVEGEAREMLGEVRAGVTRLAAIVQDLSSISRSTAAPPRPEDLADIVRAQIRVASARRGDARVLVEGDVAVWASCDRGRVAQALLNLLANAIDATNALATPTLRVRIAARDAMARITVTDDGPGIPPAIRRRLFQPFATSKRDRGTGLGLFLSRSLIQAQGGDLVLDATSPTGTSFTITLPLAKAPAVERSSVRTIPTRRRVLVIDDEVAIVRALERLLGPHADVVGAHGGPEGLAKALDGEYALVVCDWHMPEINGPELLAAIERRGVSMAHRFVLMTGSTEPGPAGMRVVRKPLDAGLLTRLLDAS